MVQLAERHAEWLVAPPATVDSRLSALERQMEKHNRHVFYPMCTRQLLVEAAEKINMLDGNKHPSGIPHPKTAPPPWATQWLNNSAGSVILVEKDLDVIYMTSIGSVRGDADASVHTIDAEDQAAAVRDVATTQPQ